MEWALNTTKSGWFRLLYLYHYITRCVTAVGYKFVDGYIDDYFYPSVMFRVTFGTRQE